MALPQDYTGVRFGKLIVLRDAPSGQLYNATTRRVHTRCDCGNESIEWLPALQTGKKQSCGCMRVGPKLHNRRPVVGNKYGRLTVTEELPDLIRNNGLRRRRVRATCECGNVGKFDLSKLSTGYTKSCGCLMIETSRKTNLKHGAARRDAKGKQRSEYSVWIGMKQRCSDPKHIGYHLWGGRGITVCNAWLNDFSAFLADMGPRPSARHSIDRIDNNGNYEPGNCRWSTQKEQCRNTRFNRMITANGATLCLQDWSLKSGLLPDTITERIKAGWCTDCAVSNSKGRGCPHQAKKPGKKAAPRGAQLTIDGETATLREFSRKYNVSIGTIHARRSHGWCDKCAITTPLYANITCTHRTSVNAASHK